MTGNASYRRASNRAKSMTSKLHTIVFDLIEGTSRDQWRSFAEKDGLTLSWIKAFAADRIPSPSAEKLEALYEAITGKEIEYKP